METKTVVIGGGVLLLLGGVLYFATRTVAPANPAPGINPTSGGNADLQAGLNFAGILANAIGGVATAALNNRGGASGGTGPKAGSGSPGVTTTTTPAFNSNGAYYSDARQQLASTGLRVW